MTQPAATRVLFTCDGAVVPTEVVDQNWTKRLAIDAEGATPSLNLRVESLAGKVVASLDDRAQDLIRIAAACYAADQMVSRGGVDVHRENWRRELCLYLPVIDRAFWSADETTTALTEALGFGTEDAWSFRFTHRDPTTAQLRLDIDDRPLIGTPDSVVLFSGGTDSLCALVEAVAERKARPIVVSHRSAPQIDHWQKELLKRVRVEFPEWGFPHMSFWIHRKGTRPSDSSQRTRGFLFAALGAAVAGQVGLDRVLLPDNGYVSVNPPISGQFVGALASRGTHPAFLRLVNRLISPAFRNPVRVDNPLADRTRAAALRVLAKHDVPDLLDATRTCSKLRLRTEEQPHCGGCSQCIDRRFSAIAAGLKDHDPADRYELDVFVDPLPEGEPRTIALSYVDFARVTETASADGLFGHYEELVDCLDPEERPFTASAHRVTDLLNQHGKDVVRLVAGKFAELGLRLARGHLPATSLLVLLREQGADDRADVPAWPIELSIGLEPSPPGAGDGREGLSEMRHHLGVWHVSFRGTKGAYEHRVGFTQLALLLQSPKQPLDMIALSRREAVEATRRGLPADLSTDPGNNLGPELTDDALEHLILRKRQLPAEIRTARAKGQTRIVAQLSEDLQHVKKLLRSSRALGGRRRELAGPSEKARKAVSKNIHACFELFEVDLPELHAHLRQFLDLGIPPIYDPDPPERWTISF